MESIHINVASWCAGSEANGPGNRFVLWVQGCPRRCAGCFNQDTLPFRIRQLLRVEDLADRILSLTDIEGITFSGGEPMSQARALAALSKLLRPAGLSVFCYTGYTLESLHALNEHAVNDFLTQIDVLIDGPFVQPLASNQLWRGSSNQRVLFLTDRYRHLESEVNNAPSKAEVSWNGSRLEATGTWPRGFFEDLADALRDQRR